MIDLLLSGFKSGTIGQIKVIVENSYFKVQVKLQDFIIQILVLTISPYAVVRYTYLIRKHFHNIKPIFYARGFLKTKNVDSNQLHQTRNKE